MATLIAIGYPDETIALAAEHEARQLAADLIIQPDAIAVVSRNVGDEQRLQGALHGSEPVIQA